MRLTSQREIQLFAIGLAFCLLAKGVALFPFAHSIDSYPKLVAMSVNPDDASGVFEEFVAQGRLGQWALHKSLAVLGIVGPGGITFYVLAAMCCFSAIGVLLCKLWRIVDDRILSICVVGLFVIHPYHAEIFTYREATITVGLAQLLSVLGLVLAGHGRRWWVMGTVLLVGSLSLYQTAFNFAVVALIMSCLIEWRRSQVSWFPLSSEHSVERAYLRTFVSRVVALGVSLVAYVAVYKISLGLVTGASASHEAQRGARLDYTDLPERLVDVLRTIKYVFLSPEPLMPVAVKLILLLLLLLATTGLARHAWLRRGVGRWAEIIGAGVLLLGAAFAVVGVLMGLSGYLVIDRTLSAVSVLAAGLLAVVAVEGGKSERRAAFSLTAVLLVSFVGANNVMLAEQLRLNSRDRQTAGRIINRLEMNPEFASVTKIAVVGRVREYPLRFYTAKRTSDANTSAFSRPWSKANILREVSGYAFLNPSSEELERAADYCRDVNPWPHPESVVVLDDMAVIFLSHEE